MEHGQTDKHTIEQLCTMYGKKLTSVYVQYKRKKFTNWASTNVPTPEQFAVLFGGERKRTIPAKRGKTVHHVHNGTAAAFTTVEAAPFEQPQTEPKPAINWRGIAFDVVAVGIVIAHAGLIWFDCVQLWGLPGGIAGGIAFMVVLLTLLVSSDPSRGRTSGNALAFAGIIDVCAWWVHYPAFKHYAAAPDWLTGCICAVVCAASFAALYLFRDIKID